MSEAWYEQDGPWAVKDPIIESLKLRNRRSLVAMRRQVEVEIELRGENIEYDCE